VKHLESPDEARPPIPLRPRIREEIRVASSLGLGVSETGIVLVSGVQRQRMLALHSANSISKLEPIPLSARQRLVSDRPL
jgi:hypothetical protein